MVHLLKLNVFPIRMYEAFNNVTVFIFLKGSVYFQKVMGTVVFLAKQSKLYILGGLFSNLD